jgi:hypothetical protein
MVGLGTPRWSDNSAGLNNFGRVGIPLSIFGSSFSRNFVPMGLGAEQSLGGIIRLYLGRMIPLCGIIVKFNLPYLCIFRKYLCWDRGNAFICNFQAENCNIDQVYGNFEGSLTNGFKS